MTEGSSWGVPPSMPPPSAQSSTPPPPPGFAPPAAAAAMPPPVPGTGASSQFGYSAAPARAPMRTPMGQRQPTYPAVYARPDKSLAISYLLWFFLGFLGIHHFYLGKWQRGLWYLFTFGLFGIGLIVDLFTLPWQVKRVNAERQAGLR